jgi:hypothetical protein
MEKKFGRIHVKIRGLTPLLMNKLNPESLKRQSRRRLEDVDFEKQARESVYITVIDGKEQLYIPGYAVYSMIIHAATQYRSRRTSLANLLAGTIRIEPEEIPLGHCSYEIDVRPVNIQKSRVLKARAKIPKWEAEFDIVYNRILGDDAFVAETLRRILEDAGTRIGLLDYRPQHKGWFGTFEVVEFKTVE